MVKEKLANALCRVVLESVTLAVMENAPDCVGIPVIAPEDESDNPSGSAPDEMDQV